MTLFSRRGPSFDLPALLEVFDGDRGAIKALLEAALTSIRLSAQAIENASSREAIAAAAHRLLGTGATIGAQHLLDISRRIESVARTSASALPPVLLTELRGAVESLDAEICRTCHPGESGGV